MEKTSKNSENRIITIPNLLSLLRLCLIPLLVWLYLGRHDYGLTAIVLIASGLTDLVDGWIARKFHMISNLGKILDPVADKLTQITMLFCLVERYPYMLATLILLVCKEVFDTVTGLIAISRTDQIYGADWHGKVTTALFYAMMTVHLLWVDIPRPVSYGMVAVCTVAMAVSLLLYAVRNIGMIVRGKLPKSHHGSAAD